MGAYDRAARCFPRKTLLAAFVLLGAFWLGTLARQNSVANAEVRPGTPQRAFKSGSARSLVILQDIAATLSQIDERLKRIEGVVMTADKK